MRTPNFIESFAKLSIYFFDFINNLNFIIMSEKSKQNWTIVLKVISYVVTAILGALGANATNLI